MRRLAFSAACLLAACAPADQKSAETTPQTPDAAQEMTDEEINAASHEGPTGWLDADGPGETALVWRAGPNAVGFTLTCRQKDTSLVASAESTGTTAEPLAPQTPATLFIGAAPFKGKASPDEGLLTMSISLPVTPALLAAFADAQSARIVVGDSFTEAGPEGGAKLKAFGETCAMLTGVKP